MGVLCFKLVWGEYLFWLLCLFYLCTFNSPLYALICWKYRRISINNASYYIVSIHMQLFSILQLYSLLYGCCTAIQRACIVCLDEICGYKFAHSLIEHINFLIKDWELRWTCQWRSCFIVQLEELILLHIFLSCCDVDAAIGRIPAYLEMTRLQNLRAAAFRDSTPLVLVIPANLI